MNVNALDLLMRAFRRGEGTAFGMSPAAPVAAVVRAPRVADALESDTASAALARQLAGDVTGAAGAARSRMTLFPDGPAMLDGRSEGKDGDMSLPATAVAGTVARDDANSGASSASSTTALRLVASGRGAPGNAALAASADGGSPRISATAQLVSELMQTTTSAARGQTIGPTSALLDTPHVNVEDLASALRQSIVQS